MVCGELEPSLEPESAAPDLGSINKADWWEWILKIRKKETDEGKWERTEAVYQMMKWERGGK